ncbi:hypothetical protein CEXT_306251 [Caerostris extrusa]|uniref:Uncharacterized protein n=1 Tax=Caerostris extrusa TaxID=172846 RepID=A0AAV4T935_CAEEX|nr:hypothetical protein CEXT_306251 [Caerostris extrusa]
MLECSAPPFRLHVGLLTLKALPYTLDSGLLVLLYCRTFQKLITLEPETILFLEGKEKKNGLFSARKRFGVFLSGERFLADVFRGSFSLGKFSSKTFSSKTIFYLKINDIFYSVRTIYT